MGEEQPGGVGVGGGGAGGGAGSRLMKTPKEGERILAPTRRPDGTLRKPIRIRAGYVPQDEVAIYQSKGAIIMKKGTQPEIPPGYDPVHADADGKPKTKSAKRNERKKEKKLQAALASTDKGKDLDSEQADNLASEVSCAETLERLQSVETITDKISNLSVSATSVVVSPSTDQTEMSKSEESGPDIDKKIRALKKKIRLAEAQLQGDQQQPMKPEHLEKMTKVEGWRDELKVLEDKKGRSVS